MTKSTRPSVPAPMIAMAAGIAALRRRSVPMRPTSRVISGKGIERGSTIQPSVKIIAAITLTSRNGASNEIAPPAIPPSAGPPIAPRLLAASAKPIASPLRPGRARSETRARAATQLSVEPTPWTERPISNGGNAPDTAIRIEPRPVRTRPPSSNGLRPIRSARRPTGSEMIRIGIA